MTSIYKASGDSAKAKLESCYSQQEAWKIDHEKAMSLFDREELLGNMVEAFRLVEKLDELLSAKTSEAPNLYDFELDDLVKNMLSKFLEIGKDIEATTLKRFSEYQVKNLGVFQECLARARKAEANDFELNAACKLQTLLPSAAKLDNALKPISQWPD